MSEFRPNRKRSSRFSAQSERTLTFARELRRAMTPPERKLWTRIRNKKLDGFRFRRQHPAGPYILDFFCDEAMLAIELDGHHHDHDSDRTRDAWLNTQGIEVLRIPVPAFEQNIERSIARIKRTAQARIALLGGKEASEEDRAPSAAAKPAAPPRAGEDGQSPRR